ncbi:hypothetical protein KK488_09235 [Sphingobium sp. H33]|uniref:Uncharacterized protein n=1 Tax=Sphingobium nicotianae TaxID=2782607 RepID=A0A9X1IRD2_9SPHN|nr:hypothetical protein [Sphingobium nicotianae]
MVPGLGPGWLAALLLALSLLCFWPGAVTYDGVEQYRQALTGRYDDWHPPIMARLWAILSLLGPGAGPMLCLQMIAYWLGLGALARALGGRRAFSVLAVGAFPPFLGWEAVVIKDAQMAGALMLAVGLIGHYRLREKPVSRWALIIASLCIAYATLVRANAAFSTIPLAVILFAPPTLSKTLRTMLIPLGIATALLASQVASHALFGARDSGVQRSEAIYDLAAIAVRSGDPDIVGLLPQDLATLVRVQCVKPLFWDRLFGRPDCARAVAAFRRESPHSLYLTLAGAALTHPGAYLAHRLAHLNATERWLVGRDWPLAAPPAHSEPNELGLADPVSPIARWCQGFAAWLVETPLTWPVIWCLVGLRGLFLTSSRAASPRRSLATALLVSALVQEASFAVLSISSDLRYHLWPMLAIALAGLILWKGQKPNRREWFFLVALGLVIAAGLVARTILPPSPEDYGALIA